mmetsp:Transcript_2958/g.4103  ORF Transcript_2958/g.4103 Transcript_2958/m.4103 type:complete len:206 (-) Transcript_2958:4953-5570(-)
MRQEVPEHRQTFGPKIFVLVFDVHVQLRQVVFAFGLVAVVEVELDVVPSDPELVQHRGFVGVGAGRAHKKPGRLAAEEPLRPERGRFHSAVPVALQLRRDGRVAERRCSGGNAAAAVPLGKMVPQTRRKAPELGRRVQLAVRVVQAEVLHVHFLGRHAVEHLLASQIEQDVSERAVAENRLRVSQHLDAVPRSRHPDARSRRRDL